MRWGIERGFEPKKTYMEPLLDAEVPVSGISGRIRVKIVLKESKARKISVQSENGRGFLIGCSKDQIKG